MMIAPVRDEELFQLLVSHYYYEVIIVDIFRIGIRYRGQLP